MPRGKSKDYSALFGGLDLPKDRFDADREGYVDKEGNYHFNTVTGIGMGSVTPSVIKLHGENGEDNSKWIEFLAGEDHAVNIQKRNDKDHEDERYAYFKKHTNPDSEEADTTPDPMDLESYRSWSESQESEECDKADPVADFVHEFLCMLSDDEQKIMFGVFGMDEKQKDVAGEVGRKPQSVSRSIDRIMKRLEKELAEKLGYHGENRSKE